jgi:DNA transposition AAA+ family ATPase
VGLAEPDLERWRLAREQLVAVARRMRLSKTQVSQRSEIAAGTLYPWIDGTYAGNIPNVTERVEKFLTSVDQLAAAASKIPVGPGFVTTPTAERLTDMLMYAQMMPSMVIGTLGSGMGKTMTARQYARSHPGVVLVTMRPTAKSTQMMLSVIADALEVRDRNVRGHERSIGQRLRRNGRNTLLIVDEAQNLVDEAVNQLRYFLDEYGTGIALLGNLELYSRFGDKDPKPAYAQLHSRIGMRMRELQPTAGDVEALAAAWNVTDPDMVLLCHAIAHKPGALRQMGETLKLAGMYAAGEGRELTVADLRMAVHNRGLEG